jgi:hypothetical protein
MKYEYQITGSLPIAIEFHDLVKLVRDGELTAGDLVKAEWETEWHPAAEVVGLFHMAGRDDVLAIWEEEQREKERQRLAEAGRSGEIGAGELERTRQGIGASISAAEDAAEAKDRRQQGGPIRRLLGDFFSQETFHHAFRWGIAFVAANLISILSQLGRL